METLLGIYIKINVLLALTFLFWMLIKCTANLLGVEIRHSQQLAIIRKLILLNVLVIPLCLVVRRLLPGLIEEAVSIVPGFSWAGEMSVSADINGGLNQVVPVGAWLVSVKYVLLAVFFAGFSLVVARLYCKISKLRILVNNATELRKLASVHILISETITSPFSTLALGRKQIVIPHNLLESPENLRLAIKHELQHMRSGDLNWVLFLEVIKTVCFWNPVIHAWHNEFDCLQEYACDEAVVSRKNVNSTDYGYCLLEVAKTCTQEKLLATSNMVPRFSLFTDTHSQIKRRVMMLTANRNNQFSGVKSFMHSLLCCMGVFVSAIFLFSQSSLGQEARTADLPEPLENRAEILPVRTVAPEYPAYAIDNNVEGWVLTEFTVNEAGKVIEAIIVDKCADWSNGYCTEEGDDLFDSSALAAVEQFEFESRMDNGVPVEVPGVRYLFRYSLAED